MQSYKVSRHGESTVCCKHAIQNTTSHDVHTMNSGPTTYSTYRGISLALLPLGRRLGHSRRHVESHCFQLSKTQRRLCACRGRESGWQRCRVEGGERSLRGILWAAREGSVVVQERGKDGGWGGGGVGCVSCPWYKTC